MPFLVFQSAEDEVLGLDHYELLTEHLHPHDSNSSIHLIEGMPPTSTVDQPVRAELVEEWLEAKLVE